MKKHILILSSLLVLSIQVLGQIGRKAGDEQFLIYNYSKAVGYYEQAYKGNKSYYLARQIAACYRMMNNYKFAESWYAETVQFQEHQLEDELYYAQALRSNSKYGEAQRVYKNYASKAGLKYEDQAIWIKSCDSAITWLRHPEPFILINQSKLNTAASEWGLTINEGKLVFCSDDKAKEKGLLSNAKSYLQVNRETYGWTGRGYLNIYETKDGDSSVKPLFTDEGKRVYHVSSPSFSGDGKEVYYTVTRLVKNDKNSFFTPKPYNVNLEIYSRTLKDDGSWGKPTPFQYNDVLKYSVGDPFITPNGKYLYFSSNMPGGLGGTDLYYCKKEADNTWGTPVNLGPGINTAGNERFPRFSKEEIFYFSSDGRVGLGGLDIYETIATDKGFLAPQNLKYPINSPQDDFAIWFTGRETGYVSSNRDGGRGDDDIYTFSRKVDINNVKGTICDVKTGQPIEGAVITALNSRTGEIIRTTSDGNGQYSLPLDTFSTYNVAVEKTDYITAVANGLTTGELNNYPWKLSRITKDPIRIENIYYDFNKWALRADSKVELDKLAQLLQNNPTMEIELASHTDSRGDDKYNLKLSQRRAESVVNYLVGKGITKNRMVAKGYGETKLINNCSNGVNCSEAEHQANRRTEFTITRY